MRLDPVASVFITDNSRGFPHSRPTSSSSIGPDWRDEHRGRFPPRSATSTASPGRARPGPVGSSPTTTPATSATSPAAIFIGRLMQRRFGFETNGIGFYLFDDIADPRAFKDVYREQLDAAPWDDDENGTRDRRGAARLPVQHRALRGPRRGAQVRGIRRLSRCAQAEAREPATRMNRCTSGSTRMSLGRSGARQVEPLERRQSAERDIRLPRRERPRPEVDRRHGRRSCPATCGSSRPTPAAAGTA